MADITVEVLNSEALKAIRRTNKANPRPADVMALRKVFDEYPALWRQIGDLNRQAQRNIADSVTGTTLGREAIQRQADDLRDGLGYAEGSPIERMLIDQVVLTWLDFYRAQLTHSDKMKGASFAAADFAERRLSGAQRRHLRAVSTLATVRKMGAAGPMQINIGRNQRIYNGASPEALEDDQAGEE